MTGELVPHHDQCPRCAGIASTEITWHNLDHPGKRSFIRHLEKLGVIKKALSAAKVGNGLHQRWLREDPDYAAAFANAKHRLAELLEDTAVDRALHGTDTPIIYQGAKTGSFKTYDNNLLKFLLTVKGGPEYRKREQAPAMQINNIDARQMILTAIQAAREGRANQVEAIDAETETADPDDGGDYGT